MKRIALGAVTGLAVWFGSALAAEAQQITPTGPLQLYPGSSWVTVSATITTNYNFTVYLTTYKNGVCVGPSGSGVWYCLNGGPSYAWSSIPALDSSGWGMQVGDVITFQIMAQINALHKSTCNYQVTVQSNPTTMAPRVEASFMMASHASGARVFDAVTIRKEDVDDHFGRNERSVA